MRVATVDGLVTLFYDGSKTIYNADLHDEWWDEYLDHDSNEEGWEDWNLSDECKRYFKERQTWQQVIIEEGVTEIPINSFHGCRNIKRVIFSDTVVRIEWGAFSSCSSLSYIKLSMNLEYIGFRAFGSCILMSVFIPPSVRVVRDRAFSYNKNLAIFNVPQDTEIGQNAIHQTKLLQDSHFELDKYGHYRDQTHEVHNWLKNMNNDNEYSLHRACASFQPIKEVLLTIVRAKGIGAFKVKNEAGITPSQYLKENPYAEVEEMDIVRDYVMKMMGECN